MSHIFSSSPKMIDAIKATSAPQVNAEPPAPNMETLRRAGRASLLINTSAQGVLGNAKTGRSSLLSA